MRNDMLIQDDEMAIPPRNKSGVTWSPGGQSATNEMEIPHRRAEWQRSAGMTYSPTVQARPCSARVRSGWIPANRCGKVS